jgi:intracellular multiplication protein IcmW
MPDLSNKATHRYWFEYPDPSIYKVLSFMEGVEEGWTLDGDPNLEEALKKLGKELDDAKKLNLRKEGEFVKIATYIKATRFLRLLQCLDMNTPGAASKVIAYAEKNSKTGNEVAATFLKRNTVFERLRLLSRIFSTQRLSMITKALEEA